MSKKYETYTEITYKDSDGDFFGRDKDFYEDLGLINSKWLGSGMTVRGKSTGVREILFVDLTPMQIEKVKDAAKEFFPKGVRVKTKKFKKLSKTDLEEIRIEKKKRQKRSR